MVTPFRDWLIEQEHKKHHLIFLLEWIFVFACALPIWLFVINKIHSSVWSLALVGAVSSFYASIFVYIRVLKLTTGKKCNCLIAFTPNEISRRYVCEVEKCLEIDHGGEEWYGHFIDLYSRRYRVEIVKYRCQHCNSTWQEEIAEPACDYVLVRTIKLKD